MPALSTPGSGLNLLEHALVKAGPLRGRRGGRRGECDRKNPLGPESQIDALHGQKTSDEETGADQQNDRQREFRHYERAARAHGGRSARDAPSSFLAGGPQVSPRHGDCRRQAHQDSGEEAEGHGAAEHVRIEADLVQPGQVSGLDGQYEADARVGHQQAQ